MNGIRWALVDAIRWLRGILVCRRKGHRWNAPAQRCRDFAITRYCVRCGVEDKWSFPEWRERG